MSARKSSNAKRRPTVWIGIMSVLALGACADYVKHSDTIASSAGDAMAYNKVVHTADPWPRAAANTRITGNGQRVDKVTKRYLTGNSGNLAPPSPSLFGDVPVPGSPASNGSNGQPYGNGSANAAR